MTGETGDLFDPDLLYMGGRKAVDMTAKEKADLGARLERENGLGRRSMLFARGTAGAGHPLTFGKGEPPSDAERKRIKRARK